MVTKDIKIGQFWDIKSWVHNYTGVKITKKKIKLTHSLENLNLSKVNEIKKIRRVN